MYDVATTDGESRLKEANFRAFLDDGPAHTPSSLEVAS
jgi:hypothetical protein